MGGGGEEGRGEREERREKEGKREGEEMYPSDKGEQKHASSRGLQES